MRSNKGESDFMTDHYAKVRVSPSSLDRKIFQELQEMFALRRVDHSPTLAYVRFHAD
jgi:hypothetical protein